LERARSLLNAFLGLMEKNPMGTETMILAAARYLDQTGEERASGETPILPTSAERGPVAATVELSQETPAPGETVMLSVTLEMAPGWHVNALQPLQDYLLPTAIRLSTPEAITLATGRAPEPETVKLGFSDEPLSVYQGTVTWEIPLEVSAQAGPGPLPIRVYVDYQPCNDERCLAPETLALEVTLEVVWASA
jgi:hypothetical protein